MRAASLDIVGSTVAGPGPYMLVVQKPCTVPSRLPLLPRVVQGLEVSLRWILPVLKSIIMLDQFSGGGSTFLLYLYYRSKKSSGNEWNLAAYPSEMRDPVVIKI